MTWRRRLALLGRANFGGKKPGSETEIRTLPSQRWSGRELAVLASVSAGATYYGRRQPTGRAGGGSFTACEFSHPARPSWPAV